MSNLHCDLKMWYLVWFLLIVNPYSELPCIKIWITLSTNGNNETHRYYRCLNTPLSSRNICALKATKHGNSTHEFCYYSRNAATIHMTPFQYQCIYRIQRRALLYPLVIQIIINCCHIWVPDWRTSYLTLGQCKFETETLPLGKLTIYCLHAHRVKIPRIQYCAG